MRDLQILCGLGNGGERYPPTVFKMLSKIGSQGIEAHFPIVQSKFWCGEYIPKIDLSVN